MERKILFVGLHGTGKTTFIAAFWYFVNSDSPTKKFKMETLESGEHEYLNGICENWLQYKNVSRTSLNVDVSEEIIVSLRNLETDSVVELSVPDFSGETFNTHFRDREWTEKFDQLINEISGLVIFLNPCDTNNRPQLISDENDAARILGDTEIKTNTGIEFNPWSTDMVSNQVKLVEELQFIVHQRRHEKQLKVAIIISLWDKVESEDVSIEPEIWLVNNLPLLNQYIQSNDKIFESRVYGVSAQGLDYDETEKKNEIAEKKPEERIIVKTSKEVSNDITKPIIWVSE